MISGGPFLSRPLCFTAEPGQLQTIGVSETGSAKKGSGIDVRIDDAGSILNFRIGFSLLFDSLLWGVS